MSCVPSLWISNTPDSMDDSVSDRRLLISILFHTGEQFALIILKVTQFFFPIYMMQALESLKMIRFLYFGTIHISRQIILSCEGLSHAL